MASMTENGVRTAELVHPMLGDEWNTAYTAPIPSDFRRNLVQRFITSGVEPMTLLSAVQDTTMHTGAHRITHERENMHRLGIEDDELRAAEAVADRRIHTAQFLHRLAIWAHTASEQDYKYSHSIKGQDSRYGLELYGVFQHGNWESTGNVDRAIRRLPRQLTHDFPDSHSILVYDAKAKSKLSYRYQPIMVATEPLVIGDTELFIEHDFGLVRRRRAVADVAFTGLPVQLELFKESTALVPVDLLPPQEKQVLQERKQLGIVDKVRQSQLPPHEQELVITANRFSGKRFELGIESKAGVTIDIVPISTHYIATANVVSQ